MRCPEYELTMVFFSLSPSSIIPKKVIRTHDDLTAEDAALVAHLHRIAILLASQLGLSAGYRLVINCKEQAGQTVPHLHVHLLGGRDMAWPPG